MNRNNFTNSNNPFSFNQHRQTIASTYQKEKLESDLRDISAKLKEGYEADLKKFREDCEKIVARGKKSAIELSQVPSTPASVTSESTPAESTRANTRPK